MTTKCFLIKVVDSFKKKALLMNCLSLSAFKILFWSWCVYVWISLILSYLEFTEPLRYLNYYFSSNLSSLGLLFLQTSFCSFCSTLFLGLPSCVCCRCPRLCLFSFTLFFFCSSVFNLNIPIFKFADPENSLAVQWLGLHAFTAKGVGSVPGQGTKIPQAAWQGL